MSLVCLGLRTESRRLLKRSHQARRIRLKLIYWTELKVSLFIELFMFIISISNKNKDCYLYLNFLKNSFLNFKKIIVKDRKYPDSGDFITTSK